MSKKDGLLMTNSNIYGLVNPPPVPDKKLGALKHQDISSAAVRWDVFTDLSENVATLKSNTGADLAVRRMVLEQGNVDTTNLNLKTDDSLRSNYGYIQKKLFIGDNTLPKITTNKLDHTGESNYTLDVSGDVHVKGKLVVDGSRVIIRTEVLDVSDNNITLNLGGTAISARKGGISLAGTDAGFVWNNENGPGGSTNYWDTSGADISTNNIYVKDISGNDASFNIVDATQINDFRLGGHIIPTSNATYDLGSAEYKIRHLFLSDNSLWLGDKHKIDVSGGKIRFKKRQLNEIPKGLKNKFDGANLDGLKAATGKNSDNYSEYTLEDYRKYSKVLNPNDVELPIDDIIGPDDLEADEGVMNNINEIVPDASFNNVDISEALIGNSASFKSLTVNGVVIDTNGGVGGGGGATTAGSAEGYVIVPNWNRTQVISYSNPPYNDNNQQWQYGTNKYNYFGNGGLKLATRKVFSNDFYIYLLVTGGYDGSDLLFFRHNTTSNISHINTNLLNPHWELTKRVSLSINDSNITSHSIAVGKKADHTDSAFIIGFPKQSHSGGVTGSGVIYQYKYDGTTLSNNELYPKKSDGSSDITATFTNFGAVLSVYGNYLAVGEGKTESNYGGSIYIFKKESNQSYWPSSTGDYGNYKKITGDDNTEGKRLARHYANAADASYYSYGGISIYDVWLAVNGRHSDGSTSYFSRTYIYKRDTNDDWSLHQTILMTDFHYSDTTRGYDVRFFGDKLVILLTIGVLFYKLENDNWSFIQYITETVNYTRIVAMKEDKVVTCSSTNNIYSTEAQGRIYTYSDPSWNTTPLLNILPDYSLSSSETSKLGGSGFDIDLSSNTIVLNQTKVDNNGITSWNYHGAINIYNVYDQGNAFNINEKVINVKSINTFDSININGDTNSIIPLKANGKKVPGKLLLDSTDDISLNSLRYRAKKYIPNDIIDKELVDTLNSLNSNPALLNKAIFKYKDYLLLGHSGYIANHTSDDGILCGAVFIYKKGAINYKLHQTLIGTTGNLFFGSDVVMNDKYIVVGSSGMSEYGSAGEKKGGIHIFTEDSATKMWSLLTLNVDTTTIHYDSVNQGMRPSDAGDWKWDDVYAGTNKRETSLAITKDNIILVGTPGNSKNYVVYFGFSTYTNKWVTGKLNAPTVSTGNSYSFGYNVVTCQKTSTIFVSAPYVSSTTTAGNIFVYEYTSRLSFASEDVLFGSPIKTYNGTTHYFGVSMKIMDNRLIVGNPGFGETGNNGKGVITVFEPKTKYNWIGDYNNYSLSYNNSQSNSFIGSTISANSNFIFSTDYGNKKIIVWKFENGNYNFKVAIDVDSIQHTNIQYAIYGWNSMESDDDNLFYINNNTTNTGGIIMYIYNISTGRSTIDNSGVKILRAIDLSSNSIKFSKTIINEANITKLNVEKIEGTTVANNIISESMNTKQMVLNSISDDRNFTTDILESKTHINRRAGEKFGVCGIKTNTTSSVGSFLFVANDKHKYTDYDTDIQNGYSQTTLTRGHDWAIFYNVSGVWKYFAYIKPHTTHGSQGTAVQRYGDMGFTLATYGDYVAISAPSVMGDSSNPTHKTGMIYVRQLDIDYFNTEWAKGESFVNAMNSRSVDGSNYFKNYIGSSSNATYITPPDGYYSTNTHLNNLFGASIEMNNDYIIANFVNASQNIPPDNDVRDGVVFIYKKDNNDGKFKHHQTLIEGPTISSYGIRISLSGKYLAVSSPYVSQVDSGNTTRTYVGEVYIYKVNSIGNWYKVATVSPPTSDVKYYMAFGKDIINLYGDYLFVSANQSPNNNGGNDEGYVYIFKKNVLNDNFTHIQTITITNTDLFSQYQIWYHNGAATAQANVLKYNKSTINFLYKNNILAVPMPTWKTSISASDSAKGNVILYKNTNDTTWTKIQEKIGKNQYDRMGISTAMVEDSSGVEFLYGYENYMGGGIVNSYTGGIDRVIFPKNIKVDSVNGLNNIEINQKLITSNIEGKDAEFTSIKINGVGVTPGNSIIKDENGNAEIDGRLTCGSLTVNGNSITGNGGGASYDSTTDLEIRNLEVHGTLDIKNNKKLTANDADFNDASFNDVKLLGKFTTNVEVSGNIIAKDGSFNDVSFNNIEVSGNIIAKDGSFNDVSFNNIEVSGNIIAKDGSFNDVSFNNIDVSGNIKLGGKIINTIEVSGNIIAKDGSFNDVSFNNIEVSKNIIAKDGSFNDVSFNNIEVSGNIIAKDGSFNDVSFNNIEVAGTTMLNSTTTINANLIAEDSSFNNIELKNDVKILGKPYSGRVIYTAYNDVDEVPTENYAHYINQTDNHIILIVGPVEGYSYGGDSNYGKGKGRVKIYKINESGTDDPATTLIHDVNLFSINSDLNNKNYQDVIYAGFCENNIILAVDNSKFYHFIYNGTSWVSASNPTFQVTLSTTMNGYSASGSFGQSVLVSSGGGTFTSGFKFLKFYSASNIQGFSSIVFENNYLFVGCPTAIRNVGGAFKGNAGGVFVLKLINNVFVLQDAIGTISHLDLGNISNTYFGEYVQYIDNLLYVIVKEAYTGSGNGGPGTGNYVSINIYSENSDGTWTGSRKLFLHNLFNTSLSHISYYGSNTRPTGDAAEYQLLEGHRIRGVSLSKSHMAVIMSADTGINTAGIYILKKQETGLYDWSGNFVIKISNITNITKSRWETGYLWRQNQDTGSGIDSFNQFAINMTGDYLFIGNAYDKIPKSDEVLSTQTIIGSGTYYANNNTGGSITIFKYTNTTWRLDEYVHSSYFLIGHSHYMGNFIGLDKNTIFKSNIVSNCGDYNGRLVDLQVVPNKINNENMVTMNTVKIDTLFMKNDITGNNVKLHPTTKGVVLDISGDNTGSGNNGVLVNLNSSGSENTAGTMIRFSNAKTGVASGLSPFLIGAYGETFSIIEEEGGVQRRIVIRNGGNVGIGVNAPSEKLVVGGNIRCSNMRATVGIQLPVEDIAGAPSTTPGEGTMVFNRGDNKLYIYNGSAWKSYSPDP